MCKPCASVTIHSSSQQHPQFDKRGVSQTADRKRSTPAFGRLKFTCKEAQIGKDKRFQHDGGSLEGSNIHPFEPLKHESVSCFRALILRGGWSMSDMSQIMHTCCQK